MKKISYEEEKVRACLTAIEGISIAGTQNMMNLLFIRQTLQNPVTGEKEREDVESYKAE